MAQPLTVDNSAAKVQIATASGTMDCMSTLNYMHFPTVLPIDIASGATTFDKKMLVSWFVNCDTATSPVVPRHRRRDSLNGVVPYGPITGTPSTTVPGVDTDNVHYLNSIKRKNGVCLTIEFKPEYPTPPATLPTSQWPFDYYTSTNNGTTWTRNTNGLLDLGANQVGGARFHRGILEDDLGHLYMSAYLGGVSYLLKSTNGGQLWDVVRNAGVPTLISNAANESHVVQCADGSWLVVMRSGTSDNRLRYCRSTNKGVTWTAPALLPGLPIGLNPGDDLNESVDPNLLLLTNGVLVLSYGRPNQKLAFCADGSGITWANIVHTYVDANNTHATSANSGIAPLGPDTLLAYGDNYAATINPNTQGIWQKKVVVRRTSFINKKLDLKTMYIQDPTCVSTDMAYVDAAHPEARKFGALDGSNNYWSGAFKSALNASYTIDLKNNYNVNVIGVMLQRDVLQSATVEISTNGSSWTPVKTYTNKRHYCLDYTTFTATPVRYVRVTVSGAGPLVGLNEIEVYQTGETFEDNTAGAMPPLPWSAPSNGVWVSDGVIPLPTGYQSARALYLSDASTTLSIEARKSVTASTIKTFEFMIKPKGYDTSISNGAIQWRLVTFGAGAPINIFRMRVEESGNKIQYYSGGVYTDVGVTAPLNAWTKIKLVANASTDTATLWVNDVQIGAANSIPAETTAGTTMNGILFSGSGIGAAGDQALFDDIFIN